MKVLVAVDGSECSHAAVDDCLRRAWAEDTEFCVVTAVDFFEPLPALVDEKQRQVSAAQEMVKKYQDILQEKFPALKVTGRVLDGYIKIQLIEAAEQWGADLIVMGSHGRTGLSHLMLGSISQAVLESAHCAVRIVRAPKEGASRTVLLAMDDSDCTQSALSRVLSMKWEPGTKFVCLNVVPLTEAFTFSEETPTFREIIEKEIKSMEEKSRAMLEKAAEMLEGNFGSGSATCLVRDGDARDKILEAAAEFKADLIVMGSHGRNAFGRFFLGSVSDAVALHAPCSVEVVRPHGQKRAKLHVII